jgi:xylulokinase
MNGCIPIDAAGEALYPNIIHSDIRAGAQLEQISAAVPAEEFYARTGNRLDMHYTLPKMLWLREHHPEVFSRARWFINTKDALYGFLTGVYGITDYSDASLTGALRIHEGAWDDELLCALGVDPAVMPEILPSHDARGRLSDGAARAIGLPSGIPVSVGAGDGVCASHGAGLFTVGSAYANIGSSAWLCTLSDTPVIDRDMRAFNFLDMDGKRSNVCGTVQSAGAAMDWAVQNLLLPGRELTEETFDEIATLAGSVPPGAEGVFFLPTLMGERTPYWDASARGTLIGATLYHGRGHIARAAYEGVAQALHLCDGVMRENGLRYGSLALVGGGTQSGIWPQMLADMLDIETRVHLRPREATSLGAAMAAGVGVGIFKDYEDASRMAGFSGAHAPDPIRREEYARHFEIYRALYGHLCGAYASIAAYQTNGRK